MRYVGQGCEVAAFLLEEEEEAAPAVCHASGHELVE